MSYKLLSGIKSNGRAPVKCWTDGVSVEEGAFEQLEALSYLPFIYKHIAVMPDIHIGKGSTIGSVIPTKGAIIPNAVGVDLGCGMRAIKTDIILESDDISQLVLLKNHIEKAVPHGRTNNGGPGDRGAWETIPAGITNSFQTYLADRYKTLIDLEFFNHVMVINQLGTLGTGNHFIEICKDTNKNIWVVLHSGSRGIGHKIATYYTKQAKEECQRWFIDLPAKDLAFIPQGTDLFDNYIEAAKWAQDYAKMNRHIMMNACTNALGATLGAFAILEEIDCHHNFIDIENHFGQNVYITRKGATRARVGDKIIVPGSMGSPTYICKGKGNPDSFMSCSHGAGRAMSRTKARQEITLEQHIKDTEGILCKKDQDILDESPAAYKPIDKVMKAQEDLVEIKEELHQLICIKG